MIDTIEWVDMDLLNREQIFEAVKGCQYVIHAASPVVFKDGKDSENLVIKPAVNGVEFMMDACLEHGVKRIVYTSSVASVVCPKVEPKDFCFDEECWSDSTSKNVGAYVLSKTRAEMRGFEMVREWEKQGKTGYPEWVTICPSMVMGEIITQGADTSVSVIANMLSNKEPYYPRLLFNFVDIRDVCVAHIRALERPEANGQRYILSLAEHELYYNVADITEQGLREKGYDCTIKKTRIAPWVISCMSCVSKEAKMIK